MTGVVWAQTGPGSWAAAVGEARLSVSRLASTGEWTWRARFPDGREVSARRPHLTRGNAQAAAERAAVRDA